MPRYKTYLIKMTGSLIMSLARPKSKPFDLQETFDEYVNLYDYFLKSRKLNPYAFPCYMLKRTKCPIQTLLEQIYVVRVVGQSGDGLYVKPREQCHHSFAQSL